MISPVFTSPPSPLGFLRGDVPFDTLRERLLHEVGYTLIHNISGAPAISLPLGWTTGGLPVGSDFNRVAGTIKEMSYFGSFTVFQLQLASGARLKVSQSNVQRHRDDSFTWGDSVWAHWSRSAQVVLTQ